SDAGEPDRHHRDLRGLARSDPGLRRAGLTGARGVLRPWRLHRRAAGQGWMGGAPSGLLVAAAASGLFGWLTSFVVVRVRHLALIMITLGIGLLLYEMANRESWLTGGNDGLQGVAIWKLFGRFDFD